MAKAPKSGKKAGPRDVRGPIPRPPSPPKPKK